jgi:hypothetical protein
MDDQRANRVDGGALDPTRIASPSRERILAGVLLLAYIAGWALVGYAYSIRLDKLWPSQVFWVVYAAWLAIMVVLPILVVCLFFGIVRSPAWLRGQFSLRTLLIVVTLVAAVLGMIVSAVEIFTPTA